MFKNFCLILALGVVLLMIPSSVSASSQKDSSQQMIMTLNGKDYQVETENNKTVQALVSRLPLKMKMSELNGNEKYHYLAKRLPANDKPVKTIKKGDIMLYNSNCIVLFYQNFKTRYDYTRIGHVKNFSSTADQLGKHNITITLKNSN